MPPREAREIDYMGIEFPSGIDGENQRTSFHKLIKRKVQPTRYQDNSALRASGLLESIKWMINNLGMTHFFSLTSSTYPRLTYEFLSSFKYVHPLGGPHTQDTIKFRMFGQNYTYSQDQMANIFQFPHGDGFACEAPLESDWQSDGFGFWHQLTGKTTTTWEGLRATTIHNPAIRYLHRILTNTIFGRENTTNVNSKELFLMQCA